MPRNKQVLMCPPDYFDVVYSINPWMDPRVAVDSPRARRQWRQARDTLRALGVTVHEMEPVPGLPDMTFAGDCGMVFGRRFLASNFRHVERRPETARYIAWFEAHGYEIVLPPEEVIFEGLGDVVYDGRTAITGTGPRSSPEALRLVREVFPELDVVAEIDLAGEEFFHVGLAAALLNDSTLLYYPEAFTPASQRRLERTFRRVIAADETDARQHFVCNSIRIGRTLLMDGCSSSLASTLATLGYEIVRCDMSEFKKSGGSVRCLIVGV